ncbi:short-chain dehydrogenase [Naematelia encephala]|uniref:Short-chain dehydrogenase n=1 Tax=Naematelia encephala TaxID=71784 RepID=A0A1Y2BIF7_9TREE|nr:short-chain dehydrogenase [Naematelia encephala]
MAVELIRRGKKILLAGRSEKSLADTAKEINAAGYYVLDTGDTDSIPAFIEKITTEHPDLDCLINNAGVQRPFQVHGPDYDFDLSKADQEIAINIRGPLHLSVGLCQKHFNTLENGAVIMNVTSQLGFIPFSVINPVYNGTKAWLHSFSVNLRTQLEKAGSKVKVVEIVPPAVETDLHRERLDPDDNKRHKGSKALTIEEFMADVVEGWENDSDIVAAGNAKAAVRAWQEAFGDKYAEAIK